MRVILACLLVAVGLGLAAAPAAAQPAGRIDVEPIIAALDGGERIVRAPGTVARFDEARVRGELGSTVRVVVLPYIAHEAYEDANGESQYYDLVRQPILEWALAHDVPLVVVEGVDTALLNGPGSLDHQLPADTDELRDTASTRHVTERLLVLSRLGRGVSPDVAEDVEVAHPAPVPASPDLVAEVAATMADGRIHNAPDRAVPVEAWVPEQAKEEFDLTVRIAAFPVLEPGEPVVDYVTPLGQAFPDDVVLVLHGDWVDVAAPDQDKALAARAFAYGDADLTLFTAADGAGSMLRQLVERYALLTAETSWGFPQPAPQPRPVPFDVARAISALAPWVLVGSAVVLGGAAALRHRNRRRTEAAAEEVALRAESASTMAAISDLGARVLAVDEGGQRADPAAAERLATARLLYDQAHTSEAMVQVRRIAEEGLEILTGGPAEPAPAAARAGEEGRTEVPPGPDEGATTTRSKRWLGLPVWLFGATAVAAVGCFLVLGGTSPREQVSAQARKVVEGLRTTSVYEEPGGPGIVDAQRARDLIGDRAIVVVLLAGTVHEDRRGGTDPRQEQCAEIADLVATSVVIVYVHDDEGSYEAEYCVGPEFANADNPVDPEDYVVGVVGGVNLGTHFRVTDTDRFAEVEEYVYTFDHYTMRDSPNGVPRRGVVVPPPPTPDALQAGQVALALAGVLAGTVALFALLRAAGGFAGRRTARAAESRTRSELINVRLNRLADTVLHPGPTTDAGVARRQAELAERYVLLLAEVEAARTADEHAEVDRDLTELEEAADVTRNLGSTP